MTNPTIAEIAEKLTAAQKRWILLERQPSGNGKWPVHNALIDKGLAGGFPWRLTSLGLSVRAYLQEQER